MALTKTKPAKKILIIEDNVMNMKLFHDLLEAHGYEIIETDDGSNVVNLAREVKPDLVLMDIQLPEVSGLDIIRQMKSVEGVRDIPVIAVTAFAMKDNEAEIMASGCNAYVAKPISIEPFLEIVQKFLGG